MTNNHNNDSLRQGNTATASQSKGKGKLEKQIPMWVASFENASKLYKESGKNLDISIDETQLKTVVDHINGEDTKTVSSWIDKFAMLCKELSKYQEKLNEEYSGRWDICNQKGQGLADKEAGLLEKESDLDSRFETLKRRNEEIDQQQAKLAKSQGNLMARERDIIQRELSAESGFGKQNREALEQFRATQAKDVTEYELVISQLSQKKVELEREVLKAKVMLTEAEQQRKTALEEKELELIRRVSELHNRESKYQKEKERFELQKQVLEEEKDSYKTDLDLKNLFTQQSIENSRREIEGTLTIERQRLDSESEDLQVAKGNLNALVDDAMEQERQSHLNELERINQKLDKAWKKVDEFKAQLEDFRELESSLGDQSAEDFLQQVDNLKQENRDLHRNYSESDSAELGEQNEYLRSRVNNLEKELSKLRPALDLASAEAAHKRVAATQLQTIELEKRVLEQNKNFLEVSIDELESRIDQLTNAHNTQTPFPAMSLMDSGKDYRSTMEQEDVPHLKQFAEELQHRIAQAEDNVRLYYPLEDIRILLGGLAMSQLHVFQGISGTGKTSLAKAFAKAMGGDCTDIAVQAGWRDRDDLLGHYNAFERRFYEKDTLQALYKAQTPRWEDSCNVVLLDEMNLSRPEQYFAEFLSALEKNNPQERLISLSETALPNAPVMLRGGCQILVPSNVWFIGTANHDETTSELADKTYDRAHVMTLPKQDHRFEIKQMNETSYSFRSLQRAFDKACAAHRSDISDLLGRLTGDGFTKQLESYFGFGWGNRFEKHALRFIPVMLETGASKGQALDHLLSTRVMRKGKVTGRYDVVPDDLRKLQEALEYFWISTDLEGAPDKSIFLIETDIRRLEGGI